MKHLLLTTILVLAAFFIIGINGCEWGDEQSEMMPIPIEQSPPDQPVEKPDAIEVDIKETKGEPEVMDDLSGLPESQEPEETEETEPPYENVDCDPETNDTLTPLEIRLCEFIESKKK